MPRIRTTIINVDDRREQLRVALRVREQLIKDLHLRADPVSPLSGTHRDEQSRPYLEFAADDIGRVRDFLREQGFESQTRVEPSTTPIGDPCQNCGNIAGPTLPTVCPNCGFRDIDPCPICGQEIPRANYRLAGNSLFVCPHPINGRYHRVRLAFNEPLIDLDGSFRQPLVVVSPVEE